jgi:hypothetical protein
MRPSTATATEMGSETTSASRLLYCVPAPEVVSDADFPYVQASRRSRVWKSSLTPFLLFATDAEFAAHLRYQAHS